MNIFDHFDSTQIVNLVERVDRRDETIEEFNRYGFPINTNKVNFFKAIRPAEPKGFSNSGVRGCFLSHMKIVKEAEKSNIDNLLIIEDDICFNSKIEELGEISILKLKEMDWDILYFGNILENNSDKIKWIETHEPMMTTHFYAINGKVFKEFINFLQKILDRSPGHPDGGPMHYDGAISTFRRQNPHIKTYYFSKNLGYQRPSKTDLHEYGLLDSNILTKKFMPFLRKLKGKCLRIIR